MNETTSTLIKNLRECGGVVSLPDDAPESVQEAFVKMIMDCPECRAMLEAKKAGDR